MKTIFNKTSLTIMLITLTLAACGNGNGKFDATGTFESEEVIVSSESAGKLVQLNLEEGSQLKQNDVVALVDTVQLHLRKKQLEASVKAVLSKQPDIKIQLAAIKEQI
ncbi:MAG: biotin/lipoyl-binding protein, partial [Bacteroidota bacterium]